MKTSQELRQLGVTEGSGALVKEITDLRRQLLELRLNVSSSHVKDYASRRRTLKAAIARALTIDRELRGS